MATLNRTAERRPRSKPMRVAVDANEMLAAAERGTLRAGRRRGDRWPFPLVALSLAGALAGAAAFCALAVSSARVTPLAPAPAHSAPGELELARGVSMTWDEQQCCRETR